MQINISGFRFMQINYEIKKGDSGDQEERGDREVERQEVCKSVKDFECVMMLVCACGVGGISFLAVNSVLARVDGVLEASHSIPVAGLFRGGST